MCATTRFFFKFLFKRDWEYEDQGIIDRRHLKFFTRRSIERMYEEAGYVVRFDEGINKTSSIGLYLYNLPFYFPRWTSYLLNALRWQK